jgi:signal peptide peptidase SppA
MRQENLQVLLDVVNMRLKGEAFSDEEIRIRLSEVEKENGDRENPRIQVGGGLGILPIYGSIFPKANLFSMLSGGTSLELFGSDLQELVDNDKVQKIIVDIDSGGGSSDMVFETGQRIRAAREVKPVIAVSNTMAGSAAYWLGAQASEFYVTPSGKVGSIGVYTVHEDVSRAVEASGSKVTFIYAGKYKTAGNPYEPLSSDAREYMQEVVDELYEQFLQEVATGRNTDVENVRANYGQGKMLTSKAALEVGMVDGVKSLDDVLTEQLALTQSPVAMEGALGSAITRYHNQVAANMVWAGNNIVISNRLEHAPEEHADPTGESPPPPRETPIEKDAEEGWRVPTPPIETEGGVMNENELRTRLGIGPEDSIEEAVESLMAEVGPLREAAANADKRTAFAQAYPDEYARMQRLEQRDRELSAKEFVKGFEQIGGTSTGLSALCLTKLEEAHLAITNRTFNHDDLGELVTAVATGGTVQYGESGSSSTGDLDTSDDPRLMFAQKVQEIQEKDELSYTAAVDIAAKAHPEMFRAYRDNLPVVKGGKR